MKSSFSHRRFHLMLNGAENDYPLKGEANPQHFSGKFSLSETPYRIARRVALEHFMSLRLKLGTGFLILVLIVVVISFVNIQASKSAADSFDQVTQVIFPETEIL